MATILQMIASLDAGSMAKTVEAMQVQADRLGKTLDSYTAKVDDAEAQASILKMTMRADKLQEKLKTDLSIDGVQKASLQLLGLEAQADRLNRKLKLDGGFFSRLGHLFSGGRGGGDGGGFFSRLTGLFGGGGSAVGGAASGAGGLNSLLSSAGPYAQGGVYGILAALAASLGPALLPATLGLGVGGVAAGGAFMIGKKESEQLAKLNKALASAKGKQKQALEQQIQQVKQSGGPALGIFGAFQNIGMGLLGSFTGALGAKGPGFSGGGPGGTAGAPSFFTGLLGILKQVAGFVKTLGPLLGDMFRASIPYLKMFTGFLEQSAKVLLPVFASMLQQMAPYLPLISKGLMQIVSGFAAFLKAIGPRGMQNSAKIFVALTIAMKYALIVLGDVINALPTIVIKTVHNVAAWWDRLRRVTADLFHNIAVLFDQWRHWWAHGWDTVYSDTIGVVIRLVRAINGWFGRLPGMILGALRGLGHSLGSFAAAALNEMWSGFKRIGASIVHWVESFGHGIVGIFKKIWGIFSPSSVFYDMGKNLMLGLEKGIRAHAHRAQNAVTGAVSGKGVAPSGPVQEYARKLLAAYGWGNQWAAFNSIVMRESGWNPLISNPSSGAYGIPQALPGSKMASAGADWRTNPYTQLRWMMGYIASRYGSPSSAWQHELSAGWYDRGGWLKPGLTLAYNATGRPEQVLPPGGSGGGNTYQITVNVPPSANKADVGRQIVESIREFERRSGNGWRR